MFSDVLEYTGGAATRVADFLVPVVSLRGGDDNVATLRAGDDVETLVGEAGCRPVPATFLCTGDDVTTLVGELGCLYPPPATFVMGLPTMPTGPPPLLCFA